MTRATRSRPARAGGVAYFIRRAGDDCAVIALHAGDRAEIIADSLAIGDAEDLRVSKIEALCAAAATVLPPRAAQPRVPAPVKKHGGRPLAFKFQGDSRMLAVKI